MATTTSAADSALRPSRLSREAGWIVTAAIALYLTLILATYAKSDPGWFHSGTGLPIANKGGAIGAWIADCLLHVFGLSAWWFVALAVVIVVRTFRRLHTEESAAPALHSRALRGGGFLLMLLASASLEALRMHSLTVSLPLEPGGIAGVGLAGVLSQGLGFLGATLILLALFAAGFSLFSGMSWIRLSEKVGEWVERAWLAVMARREAKQDRAVGEAAAQIREVRVEEQLKSFEEHEPIRIELPPVEVPRSERIVREKQVPLFSDLPDSELPTIALLDPPPTHIERPSPETLEYTSRLIERKLLDFNVQAKVHAAYPGPVITRYEIEPATGVKGSQIVNLSRDLARALSVTAIRVVETIPGTSYMGLEIPNSKREVVKLSEIVGSQAYNEAASKITLILGKDIAGKPAVADLARMPHLLVAGTTGSGKSVAINAMILSILYKASPADVRLIFIDPKMLELSVYEGIPHLLAPVVTDMKQAGNALNWCVAEMERRYKLMSAMSVRNLAGFNSKVKEAKEKKKPLTNPFTLTPESPEPLEPLPLIMVVIDELADLMMVTGKKVEEQIARIAQKARAAGIHLILATQRPSVDVITGLIKANVPTRVAFQVSSKVDSRTILDQMGAESLLGMGDMLYLAPGTGFPARLHGAFVSDQEVHRVVDFLKQRGEPQYIDGILDGPDLADASNVDGEGGGGEADPLYDQAVQIVLQNKRASISLVQRHLRIGYNRAARLLEDMEKAGLVSAMNGQGGRDIIAPNRGQN